MITAVQSAGEIYFRPVEAAPIVGPRAGEPRAQPAAQTASGAALSAPTPPLESLSREKRMLLAQLRGEVKALEGALRSADAAAAADPAAKGEEETPAILPEEEQAVVDALKEQDRETRAHEQAHAAAGGAYASAPTYEYEIGPDGQRYAVAGEVKIDASPVPGDPEATLEKMRVVERAALAPAEPSAQDRKVAQMAKAEAQQAQAEASAEAAADRRGEARDAAEAGYAAGRAATEDARAPVLAFAA